MPRLSLGARAGKAFTLPVLGRASPIAQTDACYTLRRMRAQESRQLRWPEALICLWVLVAQIWYYLQFKEQLRAILSLTFRRLWH